MFATVLSRVLEQLEHAIDTGALGLGSELPSERALARGLRASRCAVREAKARLAAKGKLHHVGRGKYRVGVRYPPLELRGRRRSALHDLRELLQARRLLWTQLSRRIAAKKGTRHHVELEKAFGDFGHAYHFCNVGDEVFRLHMRLGECLGRVARHRVYAALETRIQASLQPWDMLWKALYTLPRQHGPFDDILKSLKCGSGREAASQVRRRLKTFDALWLHEAAYHLSG